MKTVHLVFNAHLDPVWLWPWSAGLDELVNTCSSVCDLLDRHPGLIFTRGEAWAYEMVEEMAPALFRRIQRHIRRGQWEVVGGWYIQPDCNLPGWRNFERQIELGLKYFRSRFEVFPRIAYNVDSFGHAATLPDLMSRHGQHSYVMMRPQAHELTLPANLFRWRGLDGGEVSVFRIAPEYCTPAGLSWEHIEASLAGLPPGVDDTMCFVGVGDHGGGPTEALVQWCLAEAQRRRDVRLIFSSPARFFQKVSARDRWPVVSGELQHHAIGCYSVHRPVKWGLRRAEQGLERAERVAKSDRTLGRSRAAAMEKAWKWTCFSAFHDTLGGTCLPSAYEQVHAQISQATCVADEVVQLGLRRRVLRLGRDPHQRLVLANFGAGAFDDFVEHEPWLEWTEWGADWVLLDEAGQEVPYQLLQAEAIRERMVRLIFRLRVPAMELRVLRIAQRTQARLVKRNSWFSHVGRRARGRLAARCRGISVLLPQLVLREDHTDTWGHGIDRYRGTLVDAARWEEVSRLESGPLVEIWLAKGSVGASPLSLELRFPAEGNFYELRLTVDWREEHRVLQWAVSSSQSFAKFFRGIPGGVLSREADGAERPMRDFVLGEDDEGHGLGIVSPMVFSVSVGSRQIVLTLLRGCLLAHHEPHDGRVPRRQFCDRGRHEFRLRVYASGATVEMLEAAAEAMSQPPQVSDLTVGMPCRALRGHFRPMAADAG